MLKSLKHLLAAAAIAAALTGSAFAGSEAIRSVGRTVLEQSADAVVTLRIVHQVNFAFGGQGGEERENQSEALGTVISPDGLIVASLYEVDPGEAFGRQMARRMGPNSKFETKVKEVTVIMGDNSEAPAVVVLRESDSGLAFLRLKEKPAAALKHITFDKDSDAAILDEVVALSRMGEGGKRQSTAMTGEIQGIIQRPRKFFVPSSGIADAGVGTPVFNKDGKALGLVLSEVRFGSNENRPDEMTVIRPASEIIEYAAQAPAEAIEAPPAAEGDAPAGS
jgi:S1-C subfamily serine protease